MPSRLTRFFRRPLSLKRRLLYWLKAGPGILREGGASRRYNRVLRRYNAALEISPEAAGELRQAWLGMLAEGAAVPDRGAGSGGELALVGKLREETRTANRNNITRTAAYLELYAQHPELHWALLAHMVSRNGGYSMTDLKGGLLPRLLPEDDRRAIFGFLERCNGLIFHDAYPQLLLYRESRLQGKPLFHLLPLLDVSRFMRPVWERFWEKPDPAALTVCLIMNEQHYIEDRVVHNSHYRRQVLDMPFFRLEPLLQVNQVVFPYRRIKAPEPSGRQVWRLCGATVERFSDLHERIEAGKALYGMLFGNDAILKGVQAFAAAHPHTGSRADYQPAIFAANQKAPLRPVAAERLKGYGVRPGLPPFYSPRLEAVWEDQPFVAPGGGDWFADPDMIRPFDGVRPPRALDITGEACLGLYRLELAALLKSAAAGGSGGKGDSAEAMGTKNAHVRQGATPPKPSCPQDGPAWPEACAPPEADHPHSPGYTPGWPSEAADRE